MKKELTLIKIENYLLDYLKKTSHILTFGTIGSLNIERDIDLIITKKPSSKTKDFYKELHKLFFDLDRYLLDNFRANAFRFYRSEEQSFLEYLYPKKNKVFFHTHVYLNYPQIKKDWEWAMGEDDKLEVLIKNNYSCLIGSPNLLFSKEFQKSTKVDHIFLTLFQYDKINSQYPANLLLRMMSHNLDAILRKELKSTKERIIVKDKNQAIDLFYKACELLDKAK